MAILSSSFQFMGCEFKANPVYAYHTLEISSYLIKEVEQYIKQNLVTTLVDIGTGSGSLAITIAKKYPTLTIIATDISLLALQEAKKNADDHYCGHITFAEGNYVDHLPSDTCPALIMASLPYGNEFYLTPGNDIDHLSAFPPESYFHPSGDPMGCYTEMIESVLRQGRKTTAIIETGIMDEALVSSYLIRYPSLRRDYKVHDATGFSTTTLYFS